jgi:hypothetical protein
MRLHVIVSMLAISFSSPTVADTLKVNVDNVSHAESDSYFSNVVAGGGIGRFAHTREPAPLDKQTIIRLNRDTLYSSAVFDLNASPVTITRPDAGDRYMSMQVIDQDHNTFNVVHEPGPFTLMRNEIGTRYVFIATRTLYDPTKTLFEKSWKLSDVEPITPQ